MQQFRRESEGCGGRGGGSGAKPHSPKGRSEREKEDGAARLRPEKTRTPFGSCSTPSCKRPSAPPASIYRLPRPAPFGSAWLRPPAPRPPFSLAPPTSLPIGRPRFQPLLPIGPFSLPIRPQSPPRALLPSNPCLLFSSALCAGLSFFLVLLGRKI